MFVNPLDKVPQIPQDYANHIIYGGALGYLVALLSVHFGYGSTEALWNGLMICFAVSALKKIVDYFKESETLQMCAQKAAVSAVIPAVLLAGRLIGI